MASEHRITRQEGIFIGFSSGVKITPALLSLLTPCQGITTVILLNGLVLKYLITGFFTINRQSVFVSIQSFVCMRVTQGKNHQIFSLNSPSASHKTQTLCLLGHFALIFFFLLIAFPEKTVACITQLVILVVN